MRKYMKKSVLLIIVLLVFLGISCDKVEQPYVTVKDITVDSTKRKILLEDYTGSKCVNCPEASQVAMTLQELYQGQVIVMAVHAGFYADPDPSGHYSVDYRVPEGVAWFNDFNLQFNPMGMINRVDINGTKAIKQASWADVVTETSDDSRVASISISADYTPQNRGGINTTIDTKFLEELPGAYSLSVCILEDSIIGWQKNNDTLVGPVPDIEDYVFMDMLRAVINDTYGDELTASVDTSETYTMTYSYPADPIWVPKNLSIVAFVFRQDTKEIIEVEKIHLIEL